MRDFVFAAATTAIGSPAGDVVSPGRAQKRRTHVETCRRPTCAGPWRPWAARRARMIGSDAAAWCARGRAAAEEVRSGREGAESRARSGRAQWSQGSSVDAQKRSGALHKVRAGSRHLLGPLDTAPAHRRTRHGSAVRPGRAERAKCRSVACEADTARLTRRRRRVRRSATTQRRLLSAAARCAGVRAARCPSRRIGLARLRPAGAEWPVRTGATGLRRADGSDAGHVARCAFSAARPPTDQRSRALQPHRRASCDSMRTDRTDR